jgi:hypothetical protein
MYFDVNGNLDGHGPRLAGQLRRNCDDVTQLRDIRRRKLGSELEGSVLGSVVVADLFGATLPAQVAANRRAVGR